tara:strand:- start:65 stop:451 length:387 start_codon:yes stop_codon:yes gene_type:complete
MTSSPTVRCKRVYDPIEEDDGYRVLVDRIWPRGIKRENLVLDAWHKELAPSTELRKWFGHDPQRWAAFYQRYHAELRQNREAVKALLEEARFRPLTLLYCARDRLHNNAVALKRYLEDEGTVDELNAP